MKHFINLIRSFDIDDWLFFLLSIFAIIFSVISFFGYLPFDEKQTSSVIVGAIGVVMMAMVAQAGKRHVDIQKLQEIMGVTKVEKIINGKDFESHVRNKIIYAKRFVLDTTLNSLGAPKNKNNPMHYYNILDERIRKNEISYRKIECIYSKPRLEGVIKRLLEYEGMNYFIRHYDAPPTPIPVLNLLSIDNEIFYLGGYFLGDAPAEVEEFISISGSEINSFLESYWNNLWELGKPLNENKQINWDEITKIAKRVGMTKKELKALVKKGST